MGNFRTIAKEGWHPKSRDGGEESWRSDFKGINQVVRLSFTLPKHDTQWTSLTETGRMDGQGKGCEWKQ